MVDLTGLVSLVGSPLIEFLYDPRYSAAGAVVVLVGAMQIPHIMWLTFEQAALAAGDSRKFFIFSAARSVLTIGFVMIGLAFGGLFGALLGQGLAGVALYPFVVWLAGSVGAWNRKHDIFYACIGSLIVLISLVVNAQAILELVAM